MIDPSRQAETLVGLGLAWQSPRALLLLFVPLGLLLLARIPARPREVATGALALWRKVAQLELPRSGRARWVPPTWVLAACLSLVLGVLGLAGPGPSGKPSTRLWTVVLDRGPGLLLPWRSNAADSTSTQSRSEVALDMTRDYLSEVTAKGDRVRWEAPGREPLELACDAWPDSNWVRPLRSNKGGSPAWERYTEAGCIWVTDRRPQRDPGEAAIILSGGAAVPGAIAVAGDRCLSWSEDAPLELIPRSKGTLLFKSVSANQTEQGEQRAGRPLPALLENLVRAWARSRGLALVRDAAPQETRTGKTADQLELEPDVVLVVEGFGAKASSVVPPEPNFEPRASGHQGDLGPWDLRDFRVRETGFEATGTCCFGNSLANGLQVPSGSSSGEGALGVRWWAAASGSGGRANLPLLYSQPGRVRFTIVELTPPSGDPAAFAVRVAELLDEALLLPPGVVPLGARRDAGPQLVAAGKVPEPGERLALGSDVPIGAWLAGFAALAAFVALVSKW